MKKTLKRALAMFLTAVMVLGAAPLSGFVGIELPSLFNFKVWAAETSGTCGDNLTWSFDESTGELTISGTGDMTNYGFDSTPPWNDLKSEITSVIVSEGVTSIADCAFRGYSSIVNIEIAGTVKHIGMHAFGDCGTIENITLGYGIESIGVQAFTSCKFDEIILPDSITTLEHHAFSGSRFKKIIIPGSIKNIPNETFDCCSIGEIIIEYGVESIGDHAFNNSTLSEISIPDSVTSIDYAAFEFCFNLSKVKLPDGLTTISDSSFFGCTSLSEIIIPDSVKVIESGAFADTNIKSVTIPEGVTTIGSSAFIPHDGSSISITLPDSVTSIGEGEYSAFPEGSVIYCPPGSYAEAYAIEYGFEYYLLSVIGDGNGTAVVSFDYTQDVNPYKGLLLQFTGLTDGKVYNTFVDGYKTCTARRLDETQAYSLALVSNRGVVFGTIDKIEFDEDNLAKAAFDNLLPRINASLTVKSPDGKVIDSGYNVQWAFTADGYWKYTGNTMKDVTVGTELTYKVTLSDALATKYIQPEAAQVTVDESGSFVCELEALPTVEVSGTVKSAEGKPLAANVFITQHLEGGISSNITVKSNTNGAFSATVAEGPITLSVKKIGYKDFTWSGSASEIPAITLEKLTGDTVTLNISEAQLGSDLALAINSAENLSFAVKADGKNISDFTVQYPSLIVTGGILSSETKLSVTVTDNSGKFIPATAELVYVAGGSNTMEIVLVPKGKISAEISSSGSEENMLMVFDNAGEKLETVTMNGMIAQSNQLEAGEYTAVVFEKSSILAAVPSLAKFGEYGLKSGTDYFAQQVTVENGKLAEISDIAVPDFDESKLLYTDKEQTYMNVNSSSAVLGELLTLTVSFGFDEATAAKVSDSVVNITLPENCDVDTNGVSINDISTIDYTLTNQILSIPVNKSSGKIKVIVRPVKMSKTGYYFFESNLGFSLSDSEIIQPIGTLQVESEDMNFSIPSETRSNKITAIGKTAPKSKVEIFVDGVLAATGETNLAGSFAIPFELVNPFNFCSYQVNCKVTMPDGDTFDSTATTVYYESAIQVSKVTMIEGRGGFTVDFLNPSEKRVSYSILPGGFSATFKVEFTENDPERVRDVYVITTDASGVETYVPVTYSEKHGYWLGTYKYDISTAPRGVTVSFNGDTEYPDSIPVEYAEEEAEVYVSFVTGLNDVVGTIIECPGGDGEFADGSFITDYTVSDEQFAKSVVTDLGYENFNINEWSGKTYFEYEIEGSPIYERYEYKENSISGTVTSYIASPDDEAYFQVEKTIFKNPDNVSGPDNASENVLKKPSFFPKISPLDIATFIPGWGGAVAGAVKNLCDIWSNSKNLKNHSDALRNSLGDVAEDLLGNCKNGQPIFSPEDAAVLWPEYQRLNDLIEDYKDECINGIQVAGVANSFLGYVGNKTGDALSKAIKYKIPNGAAGSVYKGYYGINKTFNKITTGTVNRVYTKNAVENIVSGSEYTISLAEGAVKGLKGAYAPTAMGLLYNAYACPEANIENGYQLINDQIDNLKNQLMQRANKCPPAEPKPDVAPIEVTPIVDPSGFVCEAVFSNRLEGVTVTCYYSPNEDGSDAVIWDAENYGQANPLLTDENGYYEWYVPEGWWQVCYEKDGYQIGYSDWLPVPPPQLEVHYSMTSLDAPEVECINAYSDCVEIRFSQYLDISSVNSSNIIITSNGNVIQGTWSPVNAEESFNDSSISYASVFRFVPDGNASLSGSISAEIENIENYAEKAINEKHTETVPVVLRPESISAGSEINVEFSESKEVEIVIDSAEAGAGKTVLIESSNDAIVSVSANEAVADADGKVVVTVTGNLPGEATLEYIIKDTDVSGSTTVTVGNVTETVATVRSTIESGSTVEKGTTVSFYCTTPDAEIYYTTDLSCPCVIDNPARTRYTGPITLTEDVIFIFYAVKEGMLDSKTKGFSYTVTEPPVPVTGVEIEAKEATVMKGDTLQLSAVVSPENAANKAVAWRSANEGVATVDSNGLVTAIEAGEAVIIVTTDDGEFTAEIELTVIPDEYTVKWVNENKTETETVKYGATITKPETPTKTGYTFDGWTPEVPDTMPAYDMTFTATWKANKYDAVFDANGGKWADGKEIKTVPTDFDADIEPPEAPEKPGYIFSKWSSEVGVMDSVDGKNFVAEWIAETDKRYTVETYTMNTSGEYEKSVQTLSGTTDATVNAEYRIETGFALNTGKSVLSGTVAADDSLVLKVYIDRNTYTFTTVVDGVSTETKYLYGSMVSEPAAPSKEGYKFVKWNGTIPETMPAENVTVTAEFEKIYVCPDCGSVFSDKTAYNNHAATHNGEPAKITIEGGAIINGVSLRGETVTVKAEQIDGKVFSHWVVDGAKVENANSAETKMVLESGKITITAEYDDCDCKCHKGGITAFFFKIVLFFQKLFGNNLECFCGEKH
ncbi:MAG: leucine-rich repeat protein [Clostridia bacterium]|nr:leucine-rich repeat protein [Clostridia bacterium]